MIRFISRSALVAALFAASPAIAQSPVEGWGLPASDVEPDAAVRYGTLSNGMKYAIRANDKPEGAASVRLHVDFGSLGESEDEQGLAHFIEHMAFNGSQNVPEGEMVKLLERQGLAFGPDTNAYTSFDETVYILELPVADEQRIDTALFLMRETAGNLLIQPGAVDRERGVLVSERRTRDTFALRRLRDVYEFYGPDLPYADRFPIGTDEVLLGASADTIRDLYRRYYRPENATLVVVGDVDADAIEAKIAARFSDWEAVGPEGAELPTGAVDFARPLAIDTFVDPAQPTAIMVRSYRPWSDPLDSVAERRRGEFETLAQAMFNRRMERIAQAPGAVLVGGGMSTGEFDEAALHSTIGLTLADGKWAEGLALAEQELRRAREYGFTQRELDIAMADRTTDYRLAAEQADARLSRSLADGLVDIVGEDDFITDPRWRWQLWQDEIAPQVTLEKVNAAFRELWSGSAPLIHVSDKQLPDDPAPILAAWEASRELAVTAPEDSAVAEFAYSDFGTPGTVAEDTTIEDLGIRRIAFANGTLLNLKQTDFEPGRVRVSVRMAGGSFVLPDDGIGWAPYLGFVSGTGALGRHSATELEELLAGRQVATGVNVSDDAFVTGGTTNAADLLLQLQVAAAFLTDPGWRPEAADRWQSFLGVVYNQLSATPQSVLGTKGLIAVTGGDERFGIPDRDVLEALTLDELAASYEAATTGAPIEVAIVGDVDQQAAIATVAATFGALPDRTGSYPDAADEPPATFAADRTPVTLTHSGQADQALVASYWPTTDDDDPVEAAQMQMLRAIVDLMATESIREELGATYGASVSSTMSDQFDDFGYFGISSVVAPERADEVLGVIHQTVAALRDAPPSDDLIVRARQPLIEQQRLARQNNGYWINVAAQAQTDPERLDRVRTYIDRLQAVTPDDIQALARKYLTADGVLDLRILSDQAAE